MTTECQRPSCRVPQRWKATGDASTNRWGRMRAHVECECGYRLSSGLQDAIDACNVVRVSKGLEPVPFGIVRVEPVQQPVSVPQPGLPIPIIRQPPSKPFTAVQGLAADFKARQ